VYNTVVRLCQFFCCGGKVNCEHRQSHVDFLKNDYSVSLFLRYNSLAKTYFLWNPNILLPHISFFFSINQHRHNHDRFSKISRSFCGTRNWWIIIVFFLRQQCQIYDVFSKHIETLSNLSVAMVSLKISRIFYASGKLWIILLFLQCML
jgi:hypothetical protein